jgi:signal transduction histidine kinase/ligand-binding sensor domain-containing protein
MTFSKLLVPIAVMAATTVLTAGAANSKWSLRTWQTEEGLPNNTVSSLSQTPDGFLWMATPGSLARFDGTQFELLAPSQIVSNYHQNVQALLTARDGSLWMAMSHGPVLHIRTNVVEVLTNDLPDLVIRRMLEDGEGGIWLVFPGEQLRRIANGQVQRFSATNDLPSGGYSISLACDRNGVIWFTRGGYVGQFRGGRFELLTELRGMSQMQLAAAQDGGIWICSSSRLFKFKEGGDVQDLGSYQKARPNSEATQIIEGRDESVWIGTTDNGLFHYTGTGFEQVETSHPQILCLIQDNERNIWIGTGGGGLDRIQPRAVELEGTAEGLPFVSVESICEDKSGTMWAVTQNGLLVHRMENKWGLASTNSGWPGRDAMCVTTDDRGSIWVGARNQLYRLQDGQWKSWQHSDGLIPSRIYSVLPTTNGDLWVAGTAPDSLQRLRDGQWKDFPLPQGSGYIRALARDAAGNIWAGTTRDTLFRIRGDEISDESKNVFHIATSARGICARPDGSVWFVCAGSGVAWLDGAGRTGTVTAEQGLPDNYISQIIADDNGWLWFGSDHGIFKASEQSLKDVAQGKLPRVQCIEYGRNVGLPGLQANFNRCPSTARSRDGNLWMPMSTGLAVIDPRNSAQNPNPPRVVMKRVVMDETIVAEYGNILPVQAPVNLLQPSVSLRLPPGHSRLEFDWTALNFSAPENVNFRYQLSGLDTHWIDAGAERKAGYSRLPAGKYRFKLEARNGEGEWRENSALPIFVTPFFWQTWWFLSLALLVFAAGIIAVVRYVSFRRLQTRLRSLEQQAALERERARIARDIHDDLGGSLTQITLLSALAGRDSKENTGEYFRRISATAHQLMRSLDEVVWTINPRNDNLCDMVQYAGQFAIEFLTAAGIRVKPDLPANIPDTPVSAEVRHNFFLAVKETLNNITRHAQAKEVELSGALSGGAFRMTIADDGQGFKTENAGAFADGVRNMRQRMEEIHGHCDIESASGKGTRVTLSFPIEK